MTVIKALLQYNMWILFIMDISSCRAPDTQDPHKVIYLKNGFGNLNGLRRIPGVETLLVGG